MRIIKGDELVASGLDSKEAFFVELWYSMTHKKSLDSYRARCLNSRMIIRELSEELSIGLASPSELTNITAEAQETLKTDPALPSFASHFRLLEPFFASPPLLMKEPNGDKQSKDEKEKNKERYREFTFIVSDFSAALEKRYWTALCSRLPEVIASGNKDELRTLTSHMIADLIDRNWPVGSLFGWHGHFLSQGQRKTYSFTQSLEFMLKCFTRPAQNFEVTLRLTGSENLVNLEGFASFRFSKEPPKLDTGPKKFKSQGPLVTFAQTEVTDCDFVSAALKAKESFEQIIDLLRFDYEPYHLRIDPLCLVKHVDGDIDFPVLRPMIPNPASELDATDFARFVQALDDLCSKRKTEESSLRKIRGSIRQYRFGRDSENYKDKFLNWWMGLESLAYVGKGEGIGESVIKNISRVMAIPYFNRLLTDALVTMKYRCIDWHHDLREYCQGKELTALSIEDLYSIIVSPSHRSLLLQACSVSPTMHYHCEKLFETLINPGHAKEKLEAHLRHLEWQLARLYRVRCCIVHGSEVRFRLCLLAANLEYYLKETIKFTIAKLNDSDHVLNLEEVFSRAAVAYRRSIAGLSNEDAGAANAAIKEAVFANIVV